MNDSSKKERRAPVDCRRVVADKVPYSNDPLKQSRKKKGTWWRHRPLLLYSPIGGHVQNLGVVHRHPIASLEHKDSGGFKVPSEAGGCKVSLARTDSQAFSPCWGVHIVEMRCRCSSRQPPAVSIGSHAQNHNAFKLATIPVGLCQPYTRTRIQLCVSADLGG